MLGASVALQLSDRGHEVTLFEGAESLGGLASAWSVGPVVWDRHYHVTLLSDSYTRALVARLGLEDEMEWVITRTGSHAGGELYDLSGPREYLSYPVLSLTDKARLAYTILRGSRIKDWRALERQPVEPWLRSLSGDRVFEAFWLPLLEAKLGESYRDTSAAFIWATIQRLYAARNAGLKEERFGYVPGGYARILGDLHETLVENGVDVRLGSPVERIAEGPVVNTEGRTDTFDQVVVTVPTPLVPRLIPGLEDAERERLEAISYQGVVCASVLTRRPLAGFYLTYLHDPAPFTAVVEMSAFVDPAEFGGNTLVYLPQYCAPDDPLFDQSDEEIRAQFLPALSKIYPSFESEDVIAFQVSRARNVFAVPTIDYSEKAPPFSTSLAGVHIVSSAQIINGTLNVNETLQLAERGVRHVVGVLDGVPA